MERIFCILIGYAFGLFQTAFILGKIKGIDIRKHGSGNSGTTNTLRVLGTKAGLLVFFGDCMKCIIAVYLTAWLFKDGQTATEFLKLYTGLGVILGHNFPFYMNFKGGKGIASTAGMIIAFDWHFVVVGLILFFGAFLITHYVSLGSLLVYAGFVIQMVIMGQIGFFEGFANLQLLEMYGLTFFMAVLAYYMHGANIARLILHEERKTYLFKKNKEA